MITEIKVRHDRQTGSFLAISKENGIEHSYCDGSAREAISGLIEMMQLCTPDLILTNAVDYTILQGVPNAFGAEEIIKIIWEV